VATVLDDEAGDAVAIELPRGRFVRGCGRDASSEECESGRIGRSRKPLWSLGHRGFESHLLRRVVPIQSQAGNNTGEVAVAIAPSLGLTVSKAELNRSTNRRKAHPPGPARYHGLADQWELQSCV
jgi:hypothetical protein